MLIIRSRVFFLLIAFIYMELRKLIN